MLKMSFAHLLFGLVYRFRRGRELKWKENSNGCTILCQPYFTPNLKNSIIFLTNWKMFQSLSNVWCEVGWAARTADLVFPLYYIGFLLKERKNSLWLFNIAIADPHKWSIDSIILSPTFKCLTMRFHFK